MIDKQDHCYSTFLTLEFNGTPPTQATVYNEHLFANILQWDDKQSYHDEDIEYTSQRFIYGRIQEIMQSTAELTEPITTTQSVSLSTTLDQLLQKQIQLKELNTKITNAIIDEKELEEEICEIKEYQTALSEKITVLKEILCKTIKSPQPKHSRQQVVPCP